MSKGPGPGGPAASSAPSAATAQVLQAQPEKPQHYTYLKEFRTEQCPLFVQHKCAQHRPYSCFHWHFVNQRRRRSVRRRDGAFNYSPDIYCTKYDETTGLCPEGDECPFLHRTTGDTERRYHLRYYKTGICIHETDSKGHCAKNGPHCAFAHGPHDLRSPVYDIRELQAMEALQNGQAVAEAAGEGQSALAASHIMIEKILSEEPRWQDTAYVLGNYKTELCKKPPRLCRQGYACPYYHSSKDRRRSPRKHKYRSSPCPGVKHGDEWGDPSKCEHGDACQHCHTRTEQQFHPEIYKSTKCNDMQQSGSCPRGPFCAFAHVDQPPPGDDLPPPSAVPSPTQAGPVLFVPSAAGDSVPASPSSPHAPDLSSAKLKPHPLEPRSQDQPPRQSQQELLGLLPGASPLTSGISSSLTSSLAATPPSPAGTSSAPGMNANALPFYPTSDTVESVIESALDDLDLTEFGVAALEKTFDSGPVPPTGGGIVIGLNGMSSSIWEHFPSGSFSPGTSPALPSGLGAAELARLRQELEEANGTIKQWEESWKQAKQACDAWKKEAEEASERASAAGVECEVARGQRDALEQQVRKLQGDLERLHSGRDPPDPADPPAPPRSFSDLEALPLATLYGLQQQLRSNLDKVDKAVFQLRSQTCLKCQEQKRVVLPCQHAVLCEPCAQEADCPVCRSPRPQPPPS
ncbi:RING finger protein unkempt homolog isoform X2 [Ornithorhynchus anatinus]|uniref:RING finger protein unkempt homolog isoform X2 n=1 Tax=Ornithorhynchus anatinus TaxID=9258 RepID=UPI0010A90172|nr:RING finger protein unkempt homolog isoform X2 [Ornithorhynchus anatinus]